MSQALRRKIAELTLSENKLETINLPRNYAIRGIVLKLKGSITIGSGTTSGTPKDANPLQFLGTLEVRREGKDTLFRLPADVLFRLNQIWYGTAPDISGLASGDAQSDTPVKATVIIPFEVPRGISPIDTFIKASGLSSLDLLINVQTASACVQGGDRPVSVGSTAFSLVVETLEELGLDNWFFGDMKQYLVSSIEVSSSSDAFQIKPIPVGNEYYAFVLRSTVNNLPSNAVIQRIKLKSGSETFFDVDAETLRYDNKRQFGIESIPDGYYVLWLSPDGMLNSCLDVRKGTGRETLEFELKVSKQTGTNIIDVIAYEYVRPVPPKFK